MIYLSYLTEKLTTR